ncbi:MAG: hypothetical protein GVY36_19485 [Verrucomicrobia bacterium]|nr:hypothetical protein [Verrucomicrobiota bacterium]
MGLLVPESIVTNSRTEASSFIGDFSDPVIVKPLASGYVESDEGDSSIYTQRFQPCHLPALDDIQNCPVLFQRMVDKVVDVRITVLDEYMIAVSLAADDQRGDQRLDIRRDNMSDVRYEVVSIPDNIRSAITKILAKYSLRFAAIDFAINKADEWVFFEINPNGQWAWLDLCAEAKISDVFVNVFLRDQDVNLRAKCTSNLRVKMYHFWDGQHHQSGTSKINYLPVRAGMVRTSDSA